MDSNVKKFLQTHRDLINRFEFKSLYHMAKQIFLDVQMAEFWSILKQIASEYISYRNILSGYEEYFDLDRHEPKNDDFLILNEKLSFDLPITSYHELLKTLNIEYPNKIKSNIVNNILEKPDRKVSQCRVIINKFPIYTNAAINISFNLDNQQASQTLDLESIRKSNLNWIPGLCMGVNTSKIEEQMQAIENNLLLSLDEVRKEND